MATDDGCRARSLPVAPSPLLSLPPDVLYLLWRQLWTGSCSAQWALRSTCRALRQAITPLVTSLRIRTSAPRCGSASSNASALSEEDSGEECDCDCACDCFNADALVQTSLHQLQSFPCDAVLRRLQWACSGCCSMQWGLLRQVLSTFLCAGGGRLATLRDLEITGSMEIQQQQAQAIAAACPSLQRLTISGAVVRPCALPPLSALQCLRALHLSHLWSPDSPGGGSDSPTRPSPLGSLSLLSHLTALTLQGKDALQHPGSGPGQPAWPAVLETVIPPISEGGQQLRRLSLLLGFENPHNPDCLGRLSSLQRLTHLTLDIAPHPQDGATVEVNRQLAFLSLLHQMRSVSLPCTVLDTEALHMLAALPHLTRVEAMEVDPGADLSGLACIWHSMHLGYCSGPEHLTLLPLGAVRKLTFGYCCWELDALNGDDGPTFARALSSAAGVLARAWGPPGGTEGPGLRLEWSRPPPTGGAEGLGALAPLEPVAGAVTLRLGVEWDVCGEHVRRLHACLPGLRCLVVGYMLPGFPEGVGELGRCLPGLRELDVEGDPHVPVTAEVWGALTAMVSERAAAGLALCVRLGGCRWCVAALSWDVLVGAYEEQQEQRREGGRGPGGEGGTVRFCRVQKSQVGAEAGAGAAVGFHLGAGSLPSSEPSSESEGEGWW